MPLAFIRKQGGIPLVPIGPGRPKVLPDTPIPHGGGPRYKPPTETPPMRPIGPGRDTRKFAEMRPITGGVRKPTSKWDWQKTHKESDWWGWGIGLQGYTPPIREVGDNPISRDWLEAGGGWAGKETSFDPFWKGMNNEWSKMTDEQKKQWANAVSEWERGNFFYTGADGKTHVSAAWKNRDYWSGREPIDQGTKNLQGKIEQIKAEGRLQNPNMYPIAPRRLHPDLGVWKTDPPVVKPSKGKGDL